ncbi:MAG: glycoside hydrolase family 11 protein [Oscillospiraceae bacterium]|jgi:AraC-like DNA-binding protein|nr:glycoside hydrolase family 11 protein [Oscillospiraceae bacterium]
MDSSERVNGILAFIHERYKEKITAEMIAGHMKISRGECFRCFKRSLNQSLFGYINEYRLAKAAELFRTTDMSIMDISTECGFGNASYLGKLFKDAYKLTPLQYKKAQIWTENTIRNVNGCDYEYYKDTGSGTMTITGGAGNGSFTCEWGKIGNILFRGGKKFAARDRIYSQIGGISLQYDATVDAYGDSYLCVYGWMVDPLVEWYIIERFSTYKPPGDGVLLDTLETGGGTYEVYRVARKDRPSALGGGVESFDQYWSVRTSNRSSGTVDISAHFRAWEDLGLPMGKLAEVSLSVEGWLSSGNADIRTNVLKISKV